MIVRIPFRASVAALVVASAVVAGCSTPRPGPTAQEILSGSVNAEGNAFIVAVNDPVNRAVNTSPARGFPDALRRAQVIGGDTVRVGDVITVTVFENVPEGLLTSAETRGTRIESVQVDEQGFISVPFAGRIRAAGQTPEGLRSTIARQLDEQTPDPQVYISREAGNGTTVSIVGTVGSQGVYPISRHTRRLTSMLAAAGGLGIPGNTAVIRVVRGQHEGRIFYEDLMRHPELDIAMRVGDRIFVERDQRRFSVLGATGNQTLMQFDSERMSAIEAIARVGGLDPTRADPTGVFVFRNEPEEVARRLIGRQDLVGDQRVVYVLDLTRPNGMFLARDFQIRDGDTLYVTEARAVQWNRQIATLTGTLSATATAARAID